MDFYRRLNFIQLSEPHPQNYEPVIPAWMDDRSAKIPEVWQYTDVHNEIRLLFSIPLRFSPVVSLCTASVVSFAPHPLIAAASIIALSDRQTTLLNFFMFLYLPYDYVFVILRKKSL